MTKAKINSDFWAWYERKKAYDEAEIARIQAEFEALVKRERAKLGQYDENEFGPECP